MRAAWPFDDPPNVAVVAMRSVVTGGEWIASASRDAEDGGWQFHDGAPGAPREEDAMVVSLLSMVERDRSLIELADLPPGGRAWRTSRTSPWERGAVARAEG